MSDKKAQVRNFESLKKLSGWFYFDIKDGNLKKKNFFFELFEFCIRKLSKWPWKRNFKETFKEENW